MDKFSYNELMKKLNDMYDKEEKILNKINFYYQEYQQLQEDKELLQTLIKYKFNKEDRIKNLFK